MKASTKALTPSPLAVSGQIFFLYVKMFTYVLYVCFRSKKGLKWMILKENKNFGFKGKIYYVLPLLQLQQLEFFSNSPPPSPNLYNILLFSQERGEGERGRLFFLVLTFIITWLWSSNMTSQVLITECAASLTGRIFGLFIFSN